MTKEEIAEKFSFIDQDGDGKISFAEVSYAAVFRKTYPASYAAATYAAIFGDEMTYNEFKTLDLDGDGHLNIDEVTAVATHDEDISNEQVFDYIDQDNNGLISFAEANNTAFFRNEEMANSAFRLFDFDGDGHLNFEEVLSIASDDFSSIDKDNNGFISFAEARDAMNTFDDYRYTEMTDEEIEEQLRQADID